MLTKEDVDLFLSYEEKVDDRIHEVMGIIHSIDPIDDYNGSFHDMEIGKDSIELEWTVDSYCSCCDDETFYFSLLVDLLYESNDSIKERYTLKKSEKEAREKQKEVAKKKKDEEEAKMKKQNKLEKLLAEKERGEF